MLRREGWGVAVGVLEDTTDALKQARGTPGTKQKTSTLFLSLEVWTSIELFLLLVFVVLCLVCSGGGGGRVGGCRKHDLGEQAEDTQ